MLELSLRTLKIKDFYTNKENILNALNSLETDEDFNGNNGKEFTRDIAIKNGYDNTQDYVIDKLRKSDKNGYDLIDAFLSEWVGSDCYYSAYEYIPTTVGDTTVISIAFVHTH